MIVRMDERPPVTANSFTVIFRVKNNGKREDLYCF